MDSRIFMDIDADGKPQVRIEYKYTLDGSDVRDKLIGRFLLDVMYGDKKNVDVSLEYGHHDKDGAVAFIKLKK